MNTMDLAKSYLIKATARIDILAVLMKNNSYSDVVREAQEIVELASKGMLRAVGIDPPKFHDVSDILLEYKGRITRLASADIEKIAKISKLLRKERELSFYGDIDFIPTEEYTVADAKKAVEEAKFVVKAAQKVIEQ